MAVWLLENDLAQIADESDTARRAQETSAGKTSEILQHLNPFWLRIPLLNPDRVLTWLLPMCGWLFSRSLSVFGLILIGVGIGAIGTYWDTFLASSHLIFSPHNWLSMLIVWILLKIVHEMGHALVCKRYGGEVREMGLVFILFAPAAYVDVTSSWRFSSKWQRIHVAASGMYIELALAAVAAIAWSQTDSLVIRHWLFNVILMASLSTVLFNANPLMRFDGYYLLADLLEIPNLSTEGARFVQQLGSRLFLGTRSTSPERLGSRGWWIRGYGLAAWAWRLVVCASLLAASSLLFHGAGILLGVAGLLCWFGKPCVRILGGLYRHFHEMPLLVVRAGLVTAGFAAILWVSLAWMPWPTSITAPAIVEYTDLSIVRSRVDGFVEKIHVRDGQHVEAGELLLELNNDQLQMELRQLESSVSQAASLHRSALNEHDAAQAQVALSNQQALLERLAEIRQQCDHLRVLAPVDGRVVARNLRNLIGTYVNEGDELMAVGDERRKELLISVAQEQADEVLPRLGQITHFRLGNCGIYEGTLLRVEPRASRDVAPSGVERLWLAGPLPSVRPVRTRTRATVDSSNRDSQG